MKFVNKQLAIKLKEKGFDKPCFGFYNPIQDELQLYCANNKDVTYKNILISVYKNKVLVDAPTIEQVLKWLREEKKIYLNISYVPRVNNNKDFYYPNVQKIGDIEPIQFPNGAEDFDSYEDAAIIGIEYVINKLI